MKTSEIEIPRSLSWLLGKLNETLYALSTEFLYAWSELHSPPKESVLDQSITQLTGLCITTPWPQNAQSHLAPGTWKICVHRKTSDKSAKFIVRSLHTSLSWLKSVSLKMKSERDLSQRRFGTILLLFKLAGIPLNTYSVSRVQSIYNIITAVCYYVTVSSSFMDLHVNRNNLEELMKSIRLCLAMTFVTVIDIFFRYLKVKWFLWIIFKEAVTVWIWGSTNLLLYTGTPRPVVHNSADEPRLLNSSSKIKQSKR
jgi:hypothetical protein